MLKNVQGINGISSVIRKTDSPTVINCLDSSSSQNSISVSTTNADSGITTTLFLTTKYSFRSKVQIGIIGVDHKFKNVKMREPYTITIADDNKNRFINDEVGKFI